MSKLHAVKYAREATGLSLAESLRLVEGIKDHLDGDAQPARRDGSIRDEFAMAALPGLLANYEAAPGGFARLADDAYRLAAAMMDAREKVSS